MPQPKRKPAAKKAAAKRKPAAKKTPAKKPAAKRPPEPEVQVNRMTETPAPPVEETKPDDPSKTQENDGQEVGSPDPQVTEALSQIEETDEERDVAGAARREKVMTPGKPDAPEDYEPQRQELEHAGFDHYAAEEERQAELDAAREEHNRRTGDASR